MQLLIRIVNRPITEAIITIVAYRQSRLCGARQRDSPLLVVIGIIAEPGQSRRRRCPHSTPMRYELARWKSGGAGLVDWDWD